MHLYLPITSERVKLDLRLAKRALHCWLFTCAIVASHAFATLGLALVFEEKWVWQKDVVYVRDLLPIGDGQAAAVLYVTSSPQGAAPRVYGVGFQAIHSSRPNFRTAWHDIQPSCMVAPQDGDLLVLAEWNGRIWSARNLNPQEPMTAVGRHIDKGVEALELSHDGTCLISKGPHSLYAWNLERKSLLWRRPDLSLDCVAAHPHADIAVCGTATGELLELDIHSGEVIRRRLCSPSRLLSVAFNKAGDCLAFLCSDGSIALTTWPELTPIWEHSEEGISDSCSRVLTFSPCGRFLVTTGNRHANSLRVWSADRGDLVTELTGHTRQILGVRFVNSQVLYSWGLDGTIRAWDLRARAAIDVLSPPPLQERRCVLAGQLESPISLCGQK